jgi:hypothetical protein
VSRQKRLVGKWQERFLTANWRQERGPGCVGEGDRGGFAKPKQTRSEVLDGGFHTIKSTVDGSVCGLLGCGLRSAGLATLAAVVRAAVGGRAGVQCRRAVACAGRLSLLLSSLRSSGFEAPGTRHKCAFTACPGRADLPLAPPFSHSRPPKAGRVIIRQCTSTTPCPCHPPSPRLPPCPSSVSICECQSIHRLIVASCLAAPHSVQPMRPP